MATITVSAYEISVNPFREKDIEEDISDFAAGNDLLLFLRDLIGKWNEGSEETKDVVDNEKMKKVFRLAPGTLKLFGREISGIIESGEYGYTSTIIDRNNGETVHDKEIDHAEMIPFYFHLLIPENSKSGILLIQRFKQFGIYRIFRDTIKRNFKETFENHRIKFLPLVSDEIVSDFINKGKLKKITFKKFNLTPQIMNQADEGAEINEGTGYIEYSIVAGRGKTLPFYKKIFRSIKVGEGELEGLFSINDFEYNKVNVSVNLNGHSRTLDLSSLANVGAFFDITKDITINDETGHPTLESLRAIVNNIMEDLLVTLNSME